MTNAKIREVHHTALQILSLRAHSAHELKQKLQRKFPDSIPETEQVISQLLDAKLLDDAQYAEQYVAYRQSTAPRGKFALKMELQRKGIDPDTIAQALNNVSGNQEQEAAKTMALRKYGALQGQPRQKQKEKLFRFLSARGFSSEVVFEVLEEVLDSDGENS